METVAQLSLVHQIRLHRKNSTSDADQGNLVRADRQLNGPWMRGTCAAKTPVGMASFIRSTVLTRTIT